jgi:hypothetical protein
MAFPEGFDALKDSGRINIRINLKVSRFSACEQYGLTGFDVVWVCRQVIPKRSYLSSYLASALGRP